MMKSWRLLAVVMLAMSLLGCNKGSGVVPVSGTVKYEDGTIPEGEVCDVLFENAGGGAVGKMARGVIAKDGTFKLTTIEPDDGAFPGEYKVVLEVYKTYLGRERVVTPEFEKTATTPLNATVKSGEKNYFEFVVKKK